MRIYDHESAMEPVLADSPELRDLALKLTSASASLSESVHPVTAQGMATLVRSMNSYYSNLIEGHNTHPLDIERALRKDFASDPAMRALQIESAAHIDVQQLLEARLRDESQFGICAPETLCWIHREFYARLPEEFRLIKTKSGMTDRVVPGEVRKNEVEVGAHVAPKASSLPRFLARFNSAYEPSGLEALTRVIAAAASHHRFAWIHPFLDGNGRVGRLFTHGYLIRAGVDGKGLWTVSRGLARLKDKYLAALSGADAPRRNDLDGRGNLSRIGLEQFCVFFLETCLDQVEFMRNALNLDTILERIKLFAERSNGPRKIDDQSVHLLQQAFLRGKLTPGETVQILGRPERTSRRIVSDLVARQLLTSDGPGKPLRFGFPMAAVGYYFPRLYPEGVELDLQRIEL